MIATLRPAIYRPLRWLLVGVVSLLLVACGAQPAASPELERARQVAEQASWSQNVTLSFEGDQLVVRSDGLPRHELLQLYQALSVADNKTVYTVEPKGLWLRVPIPLQPRLAATKTPTRIGMIGIAVSGATIYSPFEADGTTKALEGNFVVDGIPFIDSCNGHPNPFAIQYHYHGVPYCLTRTIDRPGEHSRLLGYLLDGFPVYGPQDAGGTSITPAELDECNGHTGATPEFPQGVYHYHMTEAAPYSIPCYSGEISLSTSDLAVLTRGVDIWAYWLPLGLIGLLLAASLALALRRLRRSPRLWRSRSLPLKLALALALVLLVVSLDLAAVVAVYSLGFA